MKRLPLSLVLAAGLFALAFVALPAPAGSVAAPARIDAAADPVGVWRPSVQDRLFRLEHEMHALEADLAALRRQVSTLATPSAETLGVMPAPAG